MKDFRGVELKVGDKIAYCNRYRSNLWMVETEILEIKQTIERTWHDQKVIDVLVVRNPKWKPLEERNNKYAREGYTVPQTVTLRKPEYIVKIFT